MAGHGHGGHDEGDEIVLHQERLLPTMLLAAAFAIIVLFGLASAGGAKLEVKTGQAAYDKVKAEMPAMSHEVPMHAPNVQYKKETGDAHGQPAHQENSAAPAEEHTQPENAEHAEAEGDGHGH